jgi:peptidoglycan-associated lipoprotein
MKTTRSTLIAIAVGGALLVGAAACKKTPPVVQQPKPIPPPEQPPPPPPKPQAVRIDAFAVEPATVQQGQSATLRWAVANATDISINQGIGTVAANGTRQVTPNTSTTFTLTATGPGGTQTRTATLTVTAAPPPPPPPPKKPPVVKESGATILSREARDAFFDYDNSDIRPDARDALTRNADVLKRINAQDPAFRVSIEGHCDERGSSEYNLGLGDRRSTSAKDFLVQLGVPASMLTTVSYGKERPQCTAASEDCYQRNRRAHLTPAQ